MRPGSYHYVRRTHFLFHIGAYIIGVVLLFLVLRYLSPVLTPIFTALTIAYLLDPVVDALERRGIGRVPAVAMIMLAFGIVIIGAIAILIPMVADDVVRFGEAVPRIVQNVSSWLKANFGIEIPSDPDEVKARVAEMLKDVSLTSAGQSIFAQLGRAASSLLHLLGGLFELLLIPVFAFYFLVDFDRIVAQIRKLIPPRYRGEVGEVATEIDRVVSHWVRGTLTVVAILAVLYPIGLSIAGIQLAVPVGILVGLLTLIPYIGTFVGFSMCAILALVDWHGPRQLVIVGVVFAVLHAFEAFFLTPRIVGKKVGIGEAGALFAVIAGGELLGFVGIVVAIPLAAAIAVILRRVIRYYGESEFFNYGDPDGDRAPAPAPAPAPVPDPEPPPKQEASS